MSIWARVGGVSKWDSFRLRFGGSLEGQESPRVASALSSADAGIAKGQLGFETLSMVPTYRRLEKPKERTGFREALIGRPCVEGGIALLTVVEGRLFQLFP